MKATTTDAAVHFHKIASRFDSLYEEEKRGPLRRWLDAKLRASIYRRFELTFTQLGDLSGKRVLDVGCGGGRYCVVAEQMGAREVVGIDFAPNMIELAQELAAKSDADSSKIAFQVTDFMEADFKEPFDAAIVMGVFDYIESPAAFLARLKQTVRGRTVASFPVKFNFWTFQRKLRYCLFKNCPLYFYSRAQLTALLGELAPKDYQIEQINRDYFVTIDT